MVAPDKSKVQEVREGWPEEGELVVATVKEISPYGAYVTLDEYGNKEGFLHLSEVSTSWVRNIRDFVREGRKVVLKVLRVDLIRGQVDLSLKRVTDRERKEALLEWRRRRRGRFFLNLLSQRLKQPYEKVYEEFGRRLEESFGGLYEAFEEACERGEERLLKAGLPPEVAKEILSIANERIKVPTVKVSGTLELTCMKPMGVEVIRNTLMDIETLGKKGDAVVNIYVIAAPKYRVEVIAKDYKSAEKLLQEVVERAAQDMKKAGGTFAFKREG
jgi:translation initiation factor 2 subunit 1